MTKLAFRDVMEEILNAPRGSLLDTDSRETIESWDSVADVQLLAVVSGEFGIEADTNLLTAETVGDLIGVLESKGAFRE